MSEGQRPCEICKNKFQCSFLKRKPCITLLAWLDNSVFDIDDIMFEYIYQELEEDEPIEPEDSKNSIFLPTNPLEDIPYI